MEDGVEVPEPENDWKVFEAYTNSLPNKCPEKSILKWVVESGHHAVVTARAGCGKSELVVKVSTHVEKFL